MQQQNKKLHRQCFNAKGTATVYKTKKIVKHHY